MVADLPITAVVPYAPRPPAIPPAHLDDRPAGGPRGGPGLPPEEGPHSRRVVWELLPSRGRVDPRSSSRPVPEGIRAYDRWGSIQASGLKGLLVDLYA
ncbi:MAG: hypothetical protein AABY65_12725 [Nitrospirota bacterium]